MHGTDQFRLGPAAAGGHLKEVPAPPFPGALAHAVEKHFAGLVEIRSVFCRGTFFVAVDVAAAVDAPVLAAAAQALAAGSSATC